MVMRQAIVLMLVALLTFGGAVYGVYRLHGEALALEKAALDMIDALEHGKTDEALILMQWSYQRIQGSKVAWDAFVEHTQTDDALSLLAQAQSALKFGDAAAAHNLAHVLYEKLHCIDRDSLFSVGNLF